MGDDKDTQKHPPIDTTGQLISVENCPACDGRHDKQPIHAFNKQTPPWTHWFQCPTLNDPVPLTLVMMDGRRGMPANNTLMQFIVKAQQTGAWMVAIWRVDDGNLKIDWITNKFPTGEFGNAIEMLRSDLSKQVGAATAEKQPMQAAAEKMPPLVDLFEDEGNGSAGSADDNRASKC